MLIVSAAMTERGRHLFTEFSLMVVATVIGSLAAGARPIDDVRAEEHYNRGVNFLKANRAELAIAEFTMSIELRPKEVDTHLNLGNAYAANRQIPEAIKAWETCVQMDPNYPRAHFNLATIFKTRQQYRQALDYYKSYVSLIGMDSQEVKKINAIMSDLREKLRQVP